MQDIEIAGSDGDEGWVVFFLGKGGLRPAPNRSSAPSTASVRGITLYWRNSNGVILGSLRWEGFG
jgi:hypothetical protein